MNANRMKYASTPTYGLQKRTIFGKKAAVQQPAAEMPDFSKVPDPMSALPPQAMFAMQQQGGAVPGAIPGAIPTGFVPNAAVPFYPQNMTMPPMQNTPVQTPFMPQMGYGSGMPMQQQPYQSPVPYQPQAPMISAMPQSAAPMQPPLGNSGVSQNSGRFSLRSQGFVPPQAQQPAPQAQPQQPMLQGQPIVQQTMQRPPMGPAVQAAGYASDSGMPNQAPVYGGMPPMNAMPQQSAVYGPEGQTPYYTQPNAMPYTPMQPENAAPMYQTGAPKAAKDRKPLEADKLWSLFLFGFLPLLFIPCIFVPQSLNFLRYAFLVLSVCAMGGMWYRQMFGSSTRLIISVVYVALCIVTVSMLMQGGRDVQTAANPAAGQATVSPGDDGSGAAAVSETATPTPAPTPVGKSQAQMRLETFMSNWAGNRVEDMVNLVQPSWARAQQSPSTQLFSLLTNRTPIDYTIEEISGTDDDTSRTVTMTATIDKNNGKDPIMYRFMVLMVKESGEWYVDPNSLASNDEITTSEDSNVVNTSQSEGAATEAPRTTVSPAPPGTTMLYWNADGGHYYHIDQYCSSVKDEYLPLPNSFQYSELKQYIKDHDLSPCLKCGAPTSTLDDVAVTTE